MEKFANLYLFALVAIAALVTVIVTLRVRHKKHREQMPELGEVDDILAMDNSEFAEEGVISEVRIRENSATQTNNNQKTHDNALTELGFNDLGSMFTEDQAQEEALDSFIDDEETEETLPETEEKYSDLIVVHIMAQPGQQFIGYDLLQALLAANLRYGDMSIFHRYQDADRGGKIMFSLASATEPGIFDMNKMGVFACKGLSLFMQLDQPFHNLAALELFLMTAQQLTEDLDGVLQDAKRRELTEDTIAHYRAQVRYFQSKQKLPA